MTTTFGYFYDGGDSRYSALIGRLLLCLLHASFIVLMTKLAGALRLRVIVTQTESIMHERSIAISRALLPHIYLLSCLVCIRSAFFVRLKCLRFSRNACIFKFYYTVEGALSLLRPTPIIFAKLRYI